MTTWITEMFRKIYIRLFGYPPSDFSQELLRNFVFAAGSTGIATVLTFGVNILAARGMGPTEFGRWNLIGSWAEFLIIVPLFGLTTAIPRYLGASADESKPAIIGSGFRIVVIASVISFPVFWFIEQRFHIIKDASLVNATFVYGIILAFFYFVQSIFQGLKQFKRLSILWIISALGFVGVVLFYLYAGHNYTYFSLYWGNVVRLLFMVVAGLIFFAPMLLKYDKGMSKELRKFGSYSMLSVVAGFFSLGSIDNIMINRYLGAEAVGLYAAYYVAFSIFTGKILASFLQVLLPMASGHPNPKQLLLSILRLAWKFGIGLFLGLVILIRIIFIFYGENYIFDWRIATVLGLNITLYAIVMIVGYIITSKGIRGARYGLISSVGAATTNIFLDILLIPKFGLLGSVFASLGMVVAIAIIQFFIVRTNYLEPDATN
jgi:O-antigen/teichoic acid export membrane protein